LKHILDKSFRYVKSIDTDVRRTFARIKREREEARRLADANRTELEKKLEKLPTRKSK
jgi:hypothetical protein